MTKYVCVIQARVNSSRLPGKVLKYLDGRTVLDWCHRACDIGIEDYDVWIATSTEPADDAIEDWCFANNYNCFRGSLNDVLSRFVGVAERTDADVLLRVTADEPFVDPAVVAGVIRLHKQTGAPVVTNINPRTWADGTDVQLFTRDALMAAHAEATRPYDRDGVCTWIERNRSRFPAETLINPLPGMHTERYVLDTQKDYEYCQEIVKHWPWSKGPPSQYDILDILDRRPEIRELNAGHIMNERAFAVLAEEPLYERTYPRSKVAFERAHKVIPLAAQTFSKSHIQFPQPSPLFLSHGQGGLVWDIDGNEFCDAMSALLPNILGYRDPDVDGAIRRQLSSGISFSLATELEAELAERLCRLIPCAEAVRFGKNGTDVTTAAVRLARAYTSRDRILICGGYHGWADWSVERHLGVPEDVRKLTTRVPFGKYKAWETDKYAAVITEPNEDPGYLRYLRDVCDRSGSVLIFDEIITGFRYDMGGAQKLYGITPDLACFGKGIANGMPLSAIVGKHEIMKLMEPPDNIFYSGTFQGETLSLAAAIATIDKMERENVVAHLWHTGQTLSDAAQMLIDNYGLNEFISLYGAPPYRRVKMHGEHADQLWSLFRREMISTGVLITGSHNICYAHDKNEIKRITKSWDWTLNKMALAISNGTIAQQEIVAPMVRVS